MGRKGTYCNTLQCRKEKIRYFEMIKGVKILPPSIPTESKKVIRPRCRNSHPPLTASDVLGVQVYTYDMGILF